MSGTTPKISLQNVHKSFNGKVVLNGVNLEVAAGESVVIIGGSGTGKSVTVKCILGLLMPDAGTIKIDGHNLLEMEAGARERINMQIGMLFQHSALFDSMPVWENIAFGLLAEKRCSRRQAREIAVEKMNLVGLKPETGDLFPADLSTGMQKRVGLARAIATDPAIIFFDEPTTGLDPIMADIINKLIVHINQKVGATALTISHDMTSAKKIGDRIAMLFDGKIIWTGPSEKVDASGNAHLEQFIHGRTTGPIKMALRA